MCGELSGSFHGPAGRAGEVAGTSREHVACVAKVYIVREPGMGGKTFVRNVVAKLRELGFEGQVCELRMPDELKDLADLHIDDPARFEERLQQAILNSTRLDLSPANGQPKPKLKLAGTNESYESNESFGPRPKIVITTQEHEVNVQAVAALARDRGIYQRGGLLVRIVRDASPAGKGIRRPFAPRLDPLPPALLRERLAANAVWVAPKKTKKN
jgi:hypothetical protein